MFDFHNVSEMDKIVAQFWEAGKPVTAVCHGPAGKAHTHLL